MFAIGILVLMAIGVILLGVACYRLGDVSHALFVMRIDLGGRLEKQERAITKAAGTAEAGLEAARGAGEMASMTHGIVARWEAARVGAPQPSRASRPDPAEATGGRQRSQP